MWFKALSVVALSLGAWQKFRQMDRPIVRGGKRWWRQPDGRYARWHGIGLRREDELPPE